MNRRYGLLASIAGAAFAAWWWRSRQSAGRTGAMGASERGEVIYRNTPVPTSEGIL